MIHPTINRASVAIISSDLYGVSHGGQSFVETILAAIELPCTSGTRVRDATPRGDPADASFARRRPHRREERVEQVMPVAGTSASFATFRDARLLLASPFFRFDTLCPPPSSSSSPSCRFLEDRAPTKLDGP